MSEQNSSSGGGERKRHLSLFDGCNRTEAYQLCRKAALPVSPGETKESYIAYLDGEDPSGENNIDKWRDAIMAFIVEHPNIHSQLTCPAKSLDPKACYGCIDTQVVSCIVKNQEAEFLIRSKKQ